LDVVKVEGIILSYTNYSESSKILNVYTKQYGRIGILSKGCRSIKSNLRVVSDKMAYGYFNIYYKPNGLSSLISVDIINGFNNIKKDIEKISYAAYIIDLISQVEKETKSKDLYDILISSLIKIEDGLNPKVITSIVEFKCLSYLGVLPSIDACVICGNDKKIITIDGDKGGFICQNCYNKERIVDQKTIKLLRLFYYVDINKISELNIKEINIKEIDAFLSKYYERYTGLYLKSKQLLNAIEKYK